MVGVNVKGRALGALLVTAFQVPPPLAVTQQERLFRTVMTLDQHLRPRGAPCRSLPGVPPPLVNRPRAGPPVQRTATPWRDQSRRVGGEHTPFGHADLITLSVKEFHRIIKQDRRRRLGKL